MPNIHRYAKFVYKKIDKYLCSLKYTKIVDINNKKSDSYHWISFTFDDIHHSATGAGYNILNNYDIKSTFYISMSKVNKEGSKRGFTIDSLSKLIEEKNEIACHTYDHLRCNGKNKLIHRSILKNRKEFQSNIHGYKFNSFSFPYGTYNLNAKKIINDMFSTGRTVKSGINEGITDLNLLKSNALYSSRFSINEITELIDYNKRNNGWLIFHTHDVQDNPTDFGCDLSYLDQVAAYAIKSGATIAPVNDIHKHLLMQNSNSHF